MQIPKIPFVDRELSRRHFLGVAAAVMAMLPFVGVGSHDPPWPIMAIFVLGFTLVQYVVFSPVLLVLLALWRRLVHRFLWMDRKLPYACSSLWVLAVVATFAMTGMIAIAVMTFDIIRNRDSVRDAWHGLVLRPESYLAMLVPPSMWAIVPRLVYGAFPNTRAFEDA